MKIWRHTAYFMDKLESDWLIANGDKVLMAGPCSAESREQVLETAIGIAAYYPNAILRAGIWKPRTRPGMFEGVGEQALPWLAEAKKVTGLRVAIETASVKHIDLALKNGVDMIWIGARTTVNPFLVQELADSLKGVDIPVFVKNPIHPDLQLWIGGLERFYKAGITKLAAIHRGFHAFENSGYRNVPRWQLVHALKSRYPELPVICDISHIAGHREFLPMIAQQAYDLNLEGLMVETHCDPTSALSDAAQQVTPEALNELLTSLVKRLPSFEDTPVMNQILEIRKEIDEVDKKLLEALNRRMELAATIGELKKEYNVSILQLERWKQVIDNCMVLAAEKGLNSEFIRNVLIQVHDEAIRLQSKIWNESDNGVPKK